ncbi:MAG: hypothetical protein WD342_20535 [Verrucomicrobiales bacterium]
MRTRIARQFLIVIAGAFATISSIAEELGYDPFSTPDPAKEKEYAALGDFFFTKFDKAAEKAKIAANELSESEGETHVLEALAAAYQLQTHLSLEIAYLKNQRAAAIRNSPIPGDSLENVTLRGGRVFAAATVRDVGADAVVLAHEGGVARVLLEDLDDEWRERFGYSPEEAARAMEEDAATQRTVVQAARERAAENLRMLREKTATAEPVPAAGQIPAEVAAKIKSAAIEKWPDEYNMQEYTIENQTTAYLSLARMRVAGDVPAEIIQAAVRKWKDDYSMVVYEIENQLESKRKIR